MPELKIVLPNADFVIEGSEIAIGTKLGIDATRKLAGTGFKKPPLIKMSEEVCRKMDALLKTTNGCRSAAVI